MPVPAYLPHKDNSPPKRQFNPDCLPA